MRVTTLAVALMIAAAAPAGAADKLKIGFVNTFSGPGGILGGQYRNAFDLALEQHGGKLGGLPTEVIYVDDQWKPDVGRAAVEKLIESDKVDLLTGFNFSNILLAAIEPAKSGDTILISMNAGPSPLAGARCSRLFFTVGHENEGAAEAMGRLLQQKGIPNIYLIAPNYQAGKDMLTGFKRAYKGKVVQEVYTQPTQTDFGAELTQIRGAAPAAVFTFMPGGAGISFIKQWTQAGLRGEIPLYSVYTVDHSTLKAMGDDALGTLGVSQYVEDLPNERNKQFVAAYEAKYHLPPSEYSAQAYDTAALIDSAVRKVGGKVEDREAFLKALRAADFPSVRGEFRFNRNQFPIQNYYLRETVKRPDGGLGFVTKELAAKDYEDAYAEKCTLK